MRVSVTTGDMGVSPKEYIPSMDSKEGMFGLVVYERIMFRVMSHCYKILHQFDILNVSGVPDFIAKK